MLQYLINTEDDFELLLDYLKEQPIWAYDTETNGGDRHSVRAVGIAFGFDEFGCYVPTLHDEGKQLMPEYVWPKLKPILEDPSIEKIAHHSKFDEMVLNAHGISVQGAGHCTLIMAWLLAKRRHDKKDLKTLVKMVFGVTYDDVFKAVRGKKKRKKGTPVSFASTSLEDARVYASLDAYFTYHLYRVFKPILEGQKVWSAYNKIEMPFNRVLRNIEHQGVTIDHDYLDFADKRLPEILEEVETSIYEQSGEVFNIGSGAQLGKILFEKLRIKDPDSVPKTKRGDYVTDKHIMAKLAPKHQIIRDIQRRKKISKTHGTFVEGLKNQIGADGRVHPNFKGSGTITGRLSCSEPNLQQVEGDAVEEIKVRNFFIPASGFRFIVSDYSQVEYRIMAHFSRDKAMTEAFESGFDFHAATAAQMFDKAPEDIIHRERFIAKSINFGIGYGRGPQSVADALKCSLDEAQKYIANYYDTFAGLAAFKKHVVAKAREEGFVRTISGRKRRLLPEIRSNDWRLRGGAERQAFNTKIQGSAADIIKLAMIALEEPLAQYDARMVIQIHDELVMECPTNRCEEAVPTVKEIMENPLNGKNPLRIPIITEPEIVDRWGEVEK